MAARDGCSIKEAIVPRFVASTPSAMTCTRQTSTDPIYKEPLLGSFERLLAPDTMSKSLRPVELRMFFGDFDRTLLIRKLRSTGRADCGLKAYEVVRFAVVSSVRGRQYPVGEGRRSSGGWVGDALMAKSTLNELYVRAALLSGIYFSLID